MKERIGPMLCRLDLKKIAMRQMLFRVLDEAENCPETETPEPERSRLRAWFRRARERREVPIPIEVPASGWDSDFIFDFSELFSDEDEDPVDEMAKLLKAREIAADGDAAPKKDELTKALLEEFDVIP